MLLGKVGAGKTSVMNSLLRSSKENEKPVSGTEKCQREEIKIEQQNVVIVDTPGLCSAEKDGEEVVKEIKRCRSLVTPGPHVFLFVLTLDRFTKEEKKMVEIIKQTFGEDVISYTMVLFTHGKELKENGITIEEFIKDSDDLQNFVAECKDRYHVIDNTDQNLSQVNELVQKINTMVLENGGKYYKSPALVKKISLSVGGFAVAGAGLAATVSHFAGSSVGIAGGVGAGAAVGGVIGAVGIVVAEHIKAERCVIQ